MTELLQRLLPLLLLICIGIGSRKLGVLHEEAVQGLKNIIIKIALPAILFTSFGTMALEASYLLLFLLIFLFCMVLYGLGEFGHRWLPQVFSASYSGGYFSGFEFGMIGVGLFGALWGVEQLPVIMLIGFGHELFIWFVYVPLITIKGEGDFSFLQTMKNFIKTPTILGILLGLLMNLLGLYEAFGETLLGASLYTTFDFLMPITSPMILLVIGYSMTFKQVNLKRSMIYIGARWIVVLGIGLPLLYVIMALVEGLPPLFIQAYFAFILLPAPYILPLYIEDSQEAEFFSQLLVYSTLTSFLGYSVLVWASLA